MTGMKHNKTRVIALIVLLLSATIPQAAPAQKTDHSKEREQIVHVLNRLGFGPRPGDVDRVQSIGLRNYIEQQLHPESIPDPEVEDRLSRLASLRMNISESFRQYPDPQQLARQLGLRNPEARDKVRAVMQERGLRPPQQLLQELIAQKITRAIHSERQLQEVMTDFWFNHFNVYWGKGPVRNFTTAYEMNAIRPHVMGKFKDLLLATAKSPAMLFYLDNHLSSAPNALVDAAVRAVSNRRMGINENYARELMELHTMGVDGGYTQKDVQEVARAFTGWSINQPRQNGEFVFRPMMHDRGEKVVLGHTIKAGGGIEDGEQVIDILARHPSTARFIATKLVRRFVSDDPPQSLVDRVAKTYTQTGGDIREMLRTIFFSDEFMSPETYGQKTKSPFEYVVSAIRALDGETSGFQQLGRLIAQMGQPLYQYQAPTGFPDRGDYWMSDGAVLERINFATMLASNRAPNTQVNISAFKDAKAAALYIGSPDFQRR